MPRAPPPPYPFAPRRVGNIEMSNLTDGTTVQLKLKQYTRSYRKRRLFFLFLPKTICLSRRRRPQNRIRSVRTKRTGGSIFVRTYEIDDVVSSVIDISRLNIVNIILAACTCKNDPYVCFGLSQIVFSFTSRWINDFNVIVKRNVFYNNTLQYFIYALALTVDVYKKSTRRCRPTRPRTRV